MVKYTISGGDAMTYKRILTLCLFVPFIVAITTSFTAAKYYGPQYISHPIQHTFAQAKTISIQGKEGSVDLDLLASYEISAVVKSIENYTSDFSSQISPRDFALVWADVNTPKIDRYVTYSQKDRWYFFTVKGGFGVDIDYVDLNSANTHIIPANQTIEDIVNSVEPEDYITMNGYLVNARFANGRWNTSLIREDTGDGSCEIMYVTAITIHPN